MNMFKFTAKNKRAVRRAGIVTAIASPSVTSLVRSQGTSATCAALYCLRSTYVAAETRGDGRFRRLCAPNFSLPRWRYFFEAQRTRPLFARASQLCSRPCFNLRGKSPASLARAVLGVLHVVLADSGSADERLLLAIQKPEVTDVGLNSVRVGCHLVGWLRGCVVVADALDIVTFISTFIRCRLTSRRSPAAPVATAQGRVPHRPERLQFRLHGGLLRSGHGQLRRRPRGHHRAH
jgi:hypothetical protein